MKTCKLCSQTLPKEDFYPNNGTCKPCKRQKERQIRIDNPTRFRQYDINRKKTVKSTPPKIVPDIIIENKVISDSVKSAILKNDLLSKCRARIEHEKNGAKNND